MRADRPGVLHYVGSKVGLLVAVLEQRDAEDAQSLREQLGAAEDEVPDEWSGGRPEGVDLRQLCAATMRRNARQPQIVRLFAVLEAESLDPGHPAYDYFVARQARVVPPRGARRAVHCRPEALARQIVAMMDGLQLQWLRAQQSIGLVQEWEAAAEMLFGARPDAQP